MTAKARASESSSEMALFLFTTDASFAKEAVAAGVDYIIVDWERGPKIARQAGTGFQIGEDTEDDARRLCIDHNLPVFVRINALSLSIASEIRAATEAGCRGIMLPMARSREEVSKFLSLVPSDIRTLIQIETGELASATESIADLPWDFAHVGLNDLKLSRDAPSIWSAVTDGTVERICQSLRGRSFGFGGMTVVDCGNPIPAELVMLEMVRLSCSMGVLRRSFTADIVGRDIAYEISAVRQLLAIGSSRAIEQITLDHLRLVNAIRGSEVRNGN